MPMALVFGSDESFELYRRAQAHGNYYCEALEDMSEAVANEDWDEAKRQQVVASGHRQALALINEQIGNMMGLQLKRQGLRINAESN